MTPMTRYAVIASVAVAAVGAGFLVAKFGSPSQVKAPAGAPSGAAHATAQLLAMTIPGPDGAGQALSQWKNKVLVVNFWATWCPPCREEMPGFSRLQAKYAAKGVQFVGIAFDTADKVKEFSSLTPVNYPLLIGGSDLMPIVGELGDAIGGLPFTVVIGRDGSLLQSQLGLWKEAALEAVLVDLTR